MTALWYMTRGFGVVSLLLLTGVVLLGVTSTFTWRSARLPKFLVHGLHRNLTLLALAFLAVHVVTAVLDSFAPIRLLDAFVPFAGAYRPIWLGLGAVAFDLLLALTATSLLRARVGPRLWRALHWLAYAAWPVAVVHGLGTGTDARTGWLEALTAICVLAVAGGVLFRVSGGGSRPALRAGAAAAAIVVPVVGAVWATTGPLHAGWARRAGTPTALLGGGRLAAAAAPATATATAAVVRGPTLASPPYREVFSGTLAESQGSSGLVHVTIDAVATGSTGRHVLHLDLFGDPLAGGGVAMTASRVTFGPASAPRAYGGHVVALDGSRVAITLQTADGTGIDLALRLSIEGGSVSGILRAEAPGTGFGGSE